MKLTENQALDVWDSLCEEASEYRRLPLNSRQLCEFVWGTDRMQRCALHLLRQEQKKQAKRDRAERNKRVRPLVRFFLDERSSDEIEDVPPSVLIQIGDDTQTYEPERLRLHREWMDEAMLPYDDFDLDYGYVL